MVMTHDGSSLSRHGFSLSGLAEIDPEPGPDDEAARWECFQCQPVEYSQSPGGGGGKQRVRGVMASRGMSCDGSSRSTYCSRASRCKKCPP